MTASGTRSSGVCSHCESPIVDPTTQVVHGDKVFCCANCSAANEASGSGSDPHTLDASGEIRCAHCGVPIVSDASMVMREAQAFCCSNCAAAMGSRRQAA
jgi:hypothetical protein